MDGKYGNTLDSMEFYIAHTQKILILPQTKGIQHRCTKKLICWILEVT